MTNDEVLLMKAEKQKKKVFEFLKLAVSLYEKDALLDNINRVEITRTKETAEMTNQVQQDIFDDVEANLDLISEYLDNTNGELSKSVHGCLYEMLEPIRAEFYLKQNGEI